MAVDIVAIIFQDLGFISYGLGRDGDPTVASVGGLTAGNNASGAGLANAAKFVNTGRVGKSWVLADSGS